MDPILYPVACFVTGSTPRGGGIWRDILWAHPLGLLRRDPPLPILTSALHFLDFKVHPPALARWRSLPLRARYVQTQAGTVGAGVANGQATFTIQYE